MGVCASSQILYSNNKAISWPILDNYNTVQIVHLDGKLQEFKNQVIKASQVLSQNPNSFLCSSESMVVDARVPQLPPSEELKPGPIYFLLPLSYAKTPLSLQDLCALAIKASAALTSSANGVPEFSCAASRFQSLNGLPILRKAY